jgi:hypothetical protein
VSAMRPVATPLLCYLGFCRGSILIGHKRCRRSQNTRLEDVVDVDEPVLIASI